MTVTFQPEQIEDVSFLIGRKRGLLLHDPGAGKTPPACLFMYWCWAKQGARTIWAMPKHLMKKNKNELIRFSDFKDEDVVLVRGTRKQKDEAIKSDAKVFITTFPGLVGTRSGQAEWAKIKAVHPDINCVVLDELHKAFSTPDSKGSRELLRAMRQIEYFCGMTGTLIKGRLNSAYIMLQIIAPQFYGNYQDFLNQHALLDYWGNVSEWVNHEKITTILNQISRRRTFAEVYGDHDVNKPIFFIEHVEMGEGQQGAYDDYEQAGMLELEQLVLEGANEGVNLLRLRQILAHPDKIMVPLERDPKSNKPISFVEVSVLEESEWTPRDERLREHLEDHKDLGKPLVIFSALVPEQERVLRLCQEVGLRASLINGGASDKERDRIDEEFRNGELDVVVASYKTCATGYNWPHVDHVICLALDYDADDFIQAFRRAIRSVRSTALRVTLIQYRDTVEQPMDAILDRKSRQSYLVDSSYEVLNLSLEHRKEAENVQFD